MDEQLTMDEVEILTTLDFADAWGIENNVARRRARRRAKELGIETVPARPPRGKTIDAYSNNVSFIIYDLKTNEIIEDEFFKIPKEEDL